MDEKKSDHKTFSPSISDMKNTDKDENVLILLLLQNEKHNHQY